MRARLRASTDSRPGAAADAALLAITLTWGASFALQKVALRDVGPATFNAFRFGAAVIVLGALFWPQLRRASRDERRAGALIGVVLGASMLLQSYGLALTSASVSGFISGLPVVITPLLAVPLLGERPGRPAAAGIVLATAGLALISLTDRLTLGRGDALVLISSVGFALQIVLTGRYATRSDPRVLGTMQSVGALVACLVAALMFDRLPRTVPPSVAGIVVYLGVVNLGLVWVVQAWAQRHASATRTALVYTMEPVFAALFAALLLGEALSPRATAGALCILAAMLVSAAGPALGSRWRNRGRMTA